MALEEDSYTFSHGGHCPTCDSDTTFTASGPYFRNTLKCGHCGSNPRHRVLMHVLSTRFPQWREMAIHEGSPGWDMVSQRLAKECHNYTGSQYDVTVPFGSIVDQPRMPAKRYRSENLEAQTFLDESFDLIVTQDVFEHIFRPDLAIKEIARTLKPGGATIMTVPIVLKTNPSRLRAKMVDGEVLHILPPDRHGNPLGGGALVTVDWGYDIVSYLGHHSALALQMIQIENIDLGIRAELNEVLIGYKALIPGF